MTTNQTIDGVSRELLERFKACAEAYVDIDDSDLVELRALLDAPACKTPSGAVCPGDGVGQCKKCPTAQPKGESVTIEAVAVTRDNGDGSLRMEWLLEGGIAQLELAGMVLFAIPEANDLCDEDGSAEVYLTPPQVEQSAPVAVVLPERLDLPHRDEFESADQYAAAIGETKKWNACLDEVTRLNAKSR